MLPGGERIELKQPVAKLASILLGELVAIKILLDFILNEQKKYPLPQLQIFSDSQSAIGILTLGWDSKLHIRAVQDIKALWKAVENGGTEIKLDWSPGHASIEGNEIADRLAKEAALQAQEMEEDSQEPITQSDVKKAARETVQMLWQRRWDTSGQGKVLHDRKPKVKLKQQDYNNSTNQKILLQLQSGHCNLKEHRHKVGLDTHPYCECGDPESVEHFLLDCQITENHRETMKTNLYLRTGIQSLDLNVLLTSGEDDPWKDIRSVITEELSTFIDRSKRFIKTVQTETASKLHPNVL